MTFKEEVLAAKNQSHWTAKQRNHLRRLQKQGAVIAYWLSDAHGRPSNNVLDYLKAKAWTAKPGLVQKVDGPLVECSEKALHATFEPHKWVGSRVWMVGFLGEVKYLDNKVAGLHREIIGEIMPEEAITPSIGVKLGRKDLSGADLRYADLRSANLDYADLRYANQHYADLSSADLSSADLRYANLYSANLRSANLHDADLHDADLHDADLRSSDLSSADLSYANLRYANLSYADLSYANLYSANLSYADLSYANLRDADLHDADLHYAKWNINFPVPSGWELIPGTNELKAKS